jgi:murein DD-endopeptidase MepM/ murein hydrolase activator NlpD
MPKRRLIMLVPPRGTNVRAVRVRGVVLVAVLLMVAGGFAGYFIPFSHLALDKVEQNQRKNLEKQNKELLERIFTIRRTISQLQAEVGALEAQRHAVAPRNGAAKSKDGADKRKTPSAVAVDELQTKIALQEKQWLRHKAVLDSNPDYFEKLPVLVPIDGRAVLTVPFGTVPDPFSGRPKLHEGVDLVAEKGTGVVATAAGRVVGVGTSERWGVRVRVRHASGFTTVYAHLGRATVKEGARVKRGERIGVIGSTGLTTGPHLHYEVRRNGQAVDPMVFFYPAADSSLVSIAEPSHP